MIRLPPSPCAKDEGEVQPMVGMGAILPELL
jgi:hypothetical protein